MPKNAAQERRERIKAEFWPEDIAWTGEAPEKGWFRAPRTLSLILLLLRSKTLSGRTDPSGVYLELLTRHRDGGIVEMTSAAEHSYAAGYPGSRGVRTWQERMKLLESLGFIKTKRVGNQDFRNVLLIHPAVAVEKLHKEGKVSEIWWTTYRQMQIETKESTFEQLMQRYSSEKKGLPVTTARKKRVKKSS